MPKKKSRKKVFSAEKAVKSAARNVIGSPPPTKREVPKTKRNSEKHKPTLGSLISSDE